MEFEQIDIPVDFVILTRPITAANGNGKSTIYRIAINIYEIIAIVESPDGTTIVTETEDFLVTESVSTILYRIKEAASKGSN